MDSMLQPAIRINIGNMGSIPVQRDQVSIYGATTVSYLESVFTKDTLVYNNAAEANLRDPRTRLIFERYDDDIRSLISDDDGNETQALKPKNNRGSEVENAIISILATNTALAPLYSKALRIMPRERFVNNFRRLLKVFHDDLKSSNETLIVRELTAFLEPREVRNRIANKIADRQMPHEIHLSEETVARFQEPDESSLSYVDSWLSKGNFFPLKTPKAAKNAEEYREANDNEPEDSEEEQARNEYIMNSGMPQFPMLDLVVQACVEGQPFRDMVNNLKEFLLPHGLLQELLQIPRERIEYRTKRKRTFLDTIQEFLEDITSMEWDWWPLTAKTPSLDNENMWVHWTCVSLMLFRKKITF